MEEGERLLNLASQEYFKAINPKELKHPITHFEFKDRTQTGMKVVSFRAKKARGMMARFILENNINSLKDVTTFEEDGYFYDQENSSDEKLVFFKRTKQLNEKNIR